MAQLRDNIQLVQERIAAAAARCGKSPDDITLVAVSKTVAVEKINQAIELGIRHIGESRIQEARQKLPEITAPVTRHLIGHLQRNKVKYAVKLFDMIQSVDNLALAEELNARCAKLDMRMPILIEVNTSGEASKFGCQPEEALTLLKAIDRLPQLDTRGFMTIAVYSEDTARVRGCFKHLKRIFDEAQSLTLVNAHIDLLSLGMSSDYEVAIEEGANLVRVGSAIFGEREG